MTLQYESDRRFMAVLPYVLKVEGGYTNNPVDKGGPTMYGIAWNYNKPRLLEMGITDIRNLTKEQATEIYYEKYWLASHAELIPEINLARFHFDTAVNCGVGEASVLLHRLSKNPLYYEAGGKNADLWSQLLMEYHNQRQAYYERIVQHDPAEHEFLQGWENRINALLKPMAEPTNVVKLPVQLSVPTDAPKPESKIDESLDAVTALLNEALEKVKKTKSMAA